MEDTIAIDIVLLPPQEIWDLSVSLSEKINQGTASQALLDSTHLPHITLAQLHVEKNELKAVYKEIEHLITSLSPLALTAEKVVVVNSWVLLEISRTEALQQLHLSLIDGLMSFEQEGTAESFLRDAGELVNDFSLNWVKNFRKEKKASYDNFYPHITLGKGTTLRTIEPKDFTVRRFAVCHLGNNCTCRKILKEWKLVP